MQPNMLSIQDLTLSFPHPEGRFEAVSHLSLGLDPGRSLGIVGESGSGKSLTALSILNLLPPAARVDSGSIHYYHDQTGHVDLLQASPGQIRNIRGNHISMIFQEPMTSLNPVYTCGDQVMEIMRNHRPWSRRQARAKALEWFAEVELPQPERIFRSYPHELSGGQRQRVMIAMAVSCEPRLLIADEPTTALDVTIQQSILSLLQQLKERYGMSLIFISHDLAVVSDVADEVAVMYGGRMVEEGPRQQVIRHPVNAYTRGLIACRPPLDHQPERLQTLADFSSGRRATPIKRSPGSSRSGQPPKEKAPPTRKKAPAETSADKPTGSPSAKTTESISGQTRPTGKGSSPEQDILEQQKPVFTLQELSKDFTLKANFWGRPLQQLRALDQISLDIRKGETLGLVGESGSGKSTLARVLLNLIPPDEGRLLFKGNDLAHFSKSDLRAFRQQVQIVFQDPYSTLNPRISVGSMISEPLHYYRFYPGKRQRKDRVMELLESVRLDAGFYSRYPHELSGGQRQRVAIARVLALNPEFLVCDEAVSALDVSIQAEILNLLQDLKQQFSLTYVFITHDFSVVRFMSDRIAVMKEGRVVETGASAELFRAPADPYTRRLLESIPSV